MNISKIDGAVMDNSILVRRFTITVVNDKKNEFFCSKSCPFLESKGDDGSTASLCKLFGKQLSQAVRQNGVYRYIECSNMTNRVMELISAKQRTRKLNK